MKGYNRERYKSEELKVKSVDYVVIKRLLNFINPFRYWVLAAIGILVVSKAIEAWIPIQMGHIAQIVLGHVQDSNLQKMDMFHGIISSCVIIFGWLLLNFGLDILNIWMKNWIGQNAIFNLRTQVYEHIQRLPMRFYDSSTIGRLMTRTIHDVEQINQLFSESLIPLMGSFILFFGIFIGLFILNWHVGIVFCFIFPLTWWLVHHFRINQKRSYEFIRTIVSAMNTFIQEHLMGVNIIRNFGLDSIEKKKFDTLNEDHYQANLETIHQFSFFFSGVEFLQNITMISVFLTLVYMTPIGSSFQAGTFFTVSLYSLMIFRPLLDLAERYNILQSAMAAAERIFEILDVPEESPGPIPGLPLLEIKSVEFDNVWFAYDKEEWVLKGLSFSLKKGESVALVGVTGSGKTSVMNLLLRFYEFQKGRILINGHDINKYAVNSLRGQFSVILQDPVIFSGTIHDNISLYDPKLDFTQIKAAADYVHLNKVVEKFSDGFQHILTERGASLSVGEMQLIALARAVAHQRSALILDEATASIDGHTEKIIQDALKKILSNKTALVIAHRLSTIKDASRILVLYQGTIAESGTHDELLSAKGLYEKLYNLQFVSGHP